MSKFIGHWYKCRGQECIYKVISRVEKKEYMYNVMWVSSEGRVWKSVLYLSDYVIGIQVDAAKARAWKRYVTVTRRLTTYKFNKL